MIRQVTIIGTGLIGGSLGLALKAAGFEGTIIGCDRSPVLRQALAASAIDDGDTEPERAIRGSEVVVLATPVGAIIDLTERIGPLLPPDVLLTDVGSTKVEVAARARAVFGADAASRFLATHPMAGKEHGGIEHADRRLFEGAVWLVTPLPEQDLKSGRCAEWLPWIERLGARVIALDPARHDRLCAWISHLPQMLSTALAASLDSEFGSDPDLHAIGGRALREMTRIAQSPYSMWRDIAFTNTGNIQEALLRLEQRLAHIRENLRTRELEEEFDHAHKFKAGG